jgi:crescentin
MDNSWSLLKRFQPRDSHDSRADGPPHAAVRAQGGAAGNGPEPQDPALTLGAIGMEDELIRSRISHMVERLEDVATLKSDFAALLEPIAAFGAEYPQLRAKLLETEAMLAREREGHASLGQQIRTIRSENVKLQDQLSALNAHNQELSARTKEQEAALMAVRRDLREKEVLAADLERQVKGEAERANALVDENAALRKEAQASDAVLARYERELADARQSIEMLDHDNRTLRTASNEQATRLAALDSAHTDREHELEAARQQVADLETKLKAEQTLRHRLEAVGESERATARNNIANLEMKVQGLTSRLGVTEKLLNSTRDQLREKTEELKTAERTVREAIIGKSNLERRLEALQAEVSQTAAAAEAAQRARAELADRAEELAKGLEARETSISRLEHRGQMLLDRIDQLTADFGAERQGFEARIATLSEELQREKSERAIAQGALEMARRSRVEIHREFLKIKKMRSGANEAEEPGDGDEQRLSLVKRDAG